MPQEEPWRKRHVALGDAEVSMTATNELDAVLTQETIPDEFCRLASSTPPREKPLVASLLSGIVPVRQQDGVVCPLMLRRHLVVPLSDMSSAGGAGSCL